MLNLFLSSSYNIIHWVSLLRGQGWIHDGGRVGKLIRKAGTRTYRIWCNIKDPGLHPWAKGSQQKFQTRVDSITSVFPKMTHRLKGPNKTGAIQKQIQKSWAGSELFESRPDLQTDPVHGHQPLRNRGPWYRTHCPGPNTVKLFHREVLSKCSSQTAFF